MNLIRPAQFASWRVWLLAMALLFWLRTKINCRKKSFEITKLVHIKTWYGVSVKGEGIFPLTNQFSKPGTPLVTFDFRTNSFPTSFWLTYNHFSLIYEKPSMNERNLLKFPHGKHYCLSSQLEVDLSRKKISVHFNLNSQILTWSQKKTS